MAFSEIKDGLKLEVFDIAIVDNDNFNNNEFYVNAYKSLSEGKDKLFNIKYVSKNEANKLLDDKKIAGYVEFESNNSNIVVKENGINETILKTVTDEIIRESDMSKNIIQYEISSGNIDYNNIQQKVMTILNEKKEVINEIEKNKLDVTMIEYYTLIAMALLYGGIISMTSLNYSLANMSENGKRVAISPTNKLKVILSSLCASYIVQAIGIILLICFFV